MRGHFGADEMFRLEPALGILNDDAAQSFTWQHWPCQHCPPGFAALVARRCGGQFRPLPSHVYRRAMMPNAPCFAPRPRTSGAVSLEAIKLRPSGLAYKIDHSEIRRVQLNAPRLDEPMLKEMIRQT